MLTGLICISSNDLINYNKARNKVILLGSNNKVASLDRLMGGPFQALLVTSMCPTSKEMANDPKVHF